MIQIVSEEEFNQSLNNEMPLLTQKHPDKFIEQTKTEPTRNALL